MNGTLSEVVSFVLHDRAFATPAMDGLTRDGDATIDFDFSIEGEIFATDTGGCKHRVLGFRAKVKAVRMSSSIELAALDWRGTPAAFGHADTVLGKTIVTFIEKRPGQMDARIIADGRKLEAHPHPNPRDAGVLWGPNTLATD